VASRPLRMGLALSRRRAGPGRWVFDRR
jgi:hypothetical protein